MFEKWRKYSYAAQKHQRHRLLKAFLWFLAFCVMYNLLTIFFISTWLVENNTMQPGIQAGDRLIFISFSIQSILEVIRPGIRPPPYKRGNIVLVDTGRPEDRRLSLSVMDGFLRFFTAQRKSLFDRDEHMYVKRVVGLPGDEISMTGFVFRVKPVGGSYPLTEFEHSDKPYHPAISQTPSVWDETLPFSGNMETIVLGPQECYVVSDDRSNTNDSRTWGPVSPDMIRARAVFRYWPLKRFGRP
jgi:signal peptidase I